MRHHLLAFALILSSTVALLPRQSATAQAETTTSSSSSSSASDAEQAAIEAEEKRLRHQALLKAHRKRIIETGRNDHAATPEEYSPELELYARPVRRPVESHVSAGGDNGSSSQVELRTDIRLETEKPAPPRAADADQFVAKQMHSEAPKIDFKPYMAALSSKIKGNWYPPARQENKIVGVSFVVTPEGAVGNLKVTHSSGFSGADEAARQAILRSAPFAHLPTGCNEPRQVQYTFDHNSHQDNPSFQWGIH